MTTENYHESSFVFYESFFEMADTIADEATRALAYKTICEYALYGKRPETENQSVKIVFYAIRPQIDANKQRRENGKKGGRKPAVKEATNLLQAEAVTVAKSEGAALQEGEMTTPMVSAAESTDLQEVGAINPPVTELETSGFEKNETTKPNVNVNVNANENENANANVNVNENENANANGDATASNHHHHDNVCREDIGASKSLKQAQDQNASQSQSQTQSKAKAPVQTSGCKTHEQNPNTQPQAAYNRQGQEPRHQSAHNRHEQAQEPRQQSAHNRHEQAQRQGQAVCGDGESSRSNAMEIIYFSKNEFPTTRAEIKKFQDFTNQLFHTYGKGVPSSDDIENVFLRVYTRKEIDADTAIAVFDRGKAELLDYAFTQARAADKLNWRYLEGMYRNFDLRDIGTVAEALQYDLARRKQAC